MGRWAGGKPRHPLGNVLHEDEFLHKERFKGPFGRRHRTQIFWLRQAISINFMKIKDGSGDTSDALSAVISAFKPTIFTTEITIRPRCASSHAILILSILELLRKEELTIRYYKVHMLANQFNAPVLAQACFVTLSGYLRKCSVLGSVAGSEDEAPRFRVLAAKI